MTESTAVLTSPGLPQRIRAGMPDVGYLEVGPSDGTVVLLLRGFCAKSAGAVTSQPGSNGTPERKST
jgi:hypothetical protein